MNVILLYDDNSGKSFTVIDGMFFNVCFLYALVDALSAPVF